MPRYYVVRRLDTCPENWATYQTWVRVADFRSADLALAYIERAQGPTQRLKMFTEDR